MIIDAFFQCLLSCGDLFKVVLITLTPVALVLLALSIIRSFADV